MQAIGVLGGTFDPVHHGHLRVALELLELLQLDSVRLVPVGSPAHRSQPIASATQRLRMLEAAVADEPRLAVDAREVERAGPSYTVETLASLREELPQASLSLVMGMDQFRVLHKWHRWTELCDFAHLCVVQRPGTDAPHTPETAELLSERQVMDPRLLHTAKNGYVFMGTVPVLDISSTNIRGLLERGMSPRFLLTERVMKIIDDECIYGFNEH